MLISERPLVAVLAALATSGVIILIDIVLQHLAR